MNKKNINTIAIGDILDKAAFKIRALNPEFKPRKFHSDILNILQENNQKFSQIGINQIDDFEIETLTSMTRNFCKPLLKSGIYENNEFGIHQEELDDIIMKSKGEIALELNPNKIDELILLLTEAEIKKFKPSTLQNLYSETQDPRYKNIYDWFRKNVRRNYFSYKKGKISTTINWKLIVKEIAKHSSKGKEIANSFEITENYYTLSGAIEDLFLTLKKEKIERWNLKFLHKNNNKFYEFFTSYMKTKGIKDFSFVLKEIKNFGESGKILADKYIGYKKGDF